MKYSNHQLSANKVKKPKPARYTSPADIVANAQISDYCQTHVDVINRQSRGVIVAARKRGSHLVSLKWKTGEFVLALCKPGTRVPTDDNIVIAYQACQGVRHQDKEIKL